MKKNAGISTMMVTGMAAFVSIFAMVLLIVLRGTIGGGTDNSKALTEAEEKGEAINRSFVLDVSTADINVYWDKVNMAMICVGNDKFSVTWLERENVYRCAMSYSDSNLTAEQKAEEAQENAKNIILNPEANDGEDPSLANCRAARASMQTLAIGLRAFYVETGLDAEAKLTLRIKYNDSENKVQLLEKEYSQAYSAGAVSFREAHK